MDRLATQIRPKAHVMNVKLAMKLCNIEGKFIDTTPVPDELINEKIGKLVKQINERNGHGQNNN